LEKHYASLAVNSRNGLKNFHPVSKEIRKTEKVNRSKAGSRKET